jgi:hypothetical protein
MRPTRDDFPMPIQWLLDLLAKEPIKLVVEGELGAIDACLSLRNVYRPTEWDAVAFATEMETVEEALVRLRDEYEAGVAEDAKAAAKKEAR